MINPFRKKPEESEPQHPLLLTIQLRLENGLRRFATVLQAKTTALSPRKQKMLLCFFCLAFATASGWVAYDSVQNKPLSAVRIAPMRFVPLLSKKEPFPHLPSKELQRVHRFKRYLDSLGASPKGQAIRDSLLRDRPHLMDTLNYLENIYNNEQKNEAYGKEESKN